MTEQTVCYYDPFMPQIGTKCVSERVLGPTRGQAGAKTLPKWSL